MPSISRLIVIYSTFLSGLVASGHAADMPHSAHPSEAVFDSHCAACQMGGDAGAPKLRLKA